MTIKDGAPDALGPHYDFCIIGSGPAGLTLATELADSGKNICVVECGEKNSTARANKLREIKSLGEIKIKLTSRERILGGASTTWSGLSAPLDNIDFGHRPYLSNPTTWPISLEELRPYYQRTSSYGFSSLELFDAGSNKIKPTKDFVVDYDNLQEKIFIAADPPWNFGKKLQSIFDRGNINLQLGATVTSLASIRDADGKTLVTAANIKTLNGQDQKISADIFILATGGIENVRLLLLSRETNPAGLGNEHDLVGRYLMNHPKNNFGSLQLNKPIRSLPHLFGYLNDGWSGYAGLRIKEGRQRSLGVLNSYLRFEPIFPWTDNNGVWATITIAKKAKFLLDWWKGQQKQLVELRDWNETGDDKEIADNTGQYFDWLNAIKEILRNLPAVFAYTIHRLLPKKELLVKNIRLRNFMEMEPQPDNRLILGDDLDQNGQPLPIVTLNTSPLDRQSLVKLHQLFKEDMAKNNIGLVHSELEKAEPWPIISDASHHLGGTRMGHDPSTSVVNDQLQVHSAPNLYVLGGSVFPTSGCANPTYTICALAIRLADHLKNTSRTKA